MWRLWRKSPEGQTESRLESSTKERYCSLPKKIMCEPEDGLRKKVSWRSKSSRKGKGERRSSLDGQIRAESRAWRLLSAVGSAGVPVAHVSIATANFECVVEEWTLKVCMQARTDWSMLVLLSPWWGLQDVDSKPKQAEKQWKCVDPCKSHHYETWKNPGNASFDRVKV